LILERILLQTIKFDLQVEHPYSYLLKYAKCLKGNYKVVFFFTIELYTIERRLLEMLKIYRYF